MSRFSIEEFVDDRLGIRYRVTGANGDELVCDCPFCGKDQRLYVNESSGLWICYRCGEAGAAAALVQGVDGVTRAQALKILGRDRACSLDEVKLMLVEADSPSPPPKVGLILPDEFIPVFDDKTWRIPKYLRERGFNGRLAATYGLGYCLEGRYANRLLFPAHQFGKLVFWQGRSMTNAEPKYLAPAVDRTGVLYGLDEAVGAETVLIVEGPFDVLGCARAGFPAVALLGKVAHPAQAMALLRAGFTKAIVLLDPEASQEAAIAACLFSGVIDTDAAFIADGSDPGEATPEVIRSAVLAARPPSLRDRLLGRSA